ncbi:unnamed protein product [Mycena citricolor]|uniref:non-specific serine/threonine protein kinase n=1 Tax=Mycena citricolor TaxID=2018698 RepID=A0AAD2K6H0_9AGAR|nr:unnamed protein product [Mycena citricolor]
MDSTVPFVQVVLSADHVGPDTTGGVHYGSASIIGRRLESKNAERVPKNRIHGAALAVHHSGVGRPCELIVMLTGERNPPPSLADLSRNTSVISTSSTESELDLTPPRPRPIRTFSAPRSRSPQSPTSRAGSRPPPSYLSRELGVAEPTTSPAKGKSPARSSGKVTLHDFQFGSTLGEGSYSTVKLATSRVDGKQYAVKVITKNHLVRAGKVGTATAERDALLRLNGHPGIVFLYYTFQDEWSLYFVIDLATMGEMQSLISRLGSLSTQCTRYFSAQIADALEYIHSKGVLHRDLKPENLLLDSAYRIKITDFGTGKVLAQGGEYGFYSDYWAFGCVIFQMISGRFAFNDLSDYLTWQKIKRVEYEFPEGFDEEAKNLVQRLLVYDPSARLGAGQTDNDTTALKAHAFFSPITWTSLWTDVAPPIEPGLVVREQPSAESENARWEDFGQAWDKLALQDDEDSDEIEWAKTDPERSPGTAGRSSARDDSSSSSGHGDPAAGTSLRVQVSDPDGRAVQVERGRDRAPTPLRGGDADTTVFAAALKLSPEEHIVMHSPVEHITSRRRASRILLAIPPKSKRRHLVLTNQRLICLKLSNWSIKTEMLLASQGKTSTGVITDVQRRGQHQFVLTVSPAKMHIYSASDATSADIWVERILASQSG